MQAIVVPNRRASVWPTNSAPHRSPAFSRRRQAHGAANLRIRPAAVQAARNPTMPYRPGRPAGWLIILAAAAMVLLAVACSSSPSSPGGGGSPSASGSANPPSAIAYSHCMRSHGVPNFSDPPSSGQVPKTSAQQLAVSSSQLQAAQTACRHLYPDNGEGGGVLTKDSLGECEETGDCPQALVQAAMTALRIYAQCMRSHGLPTWPDPTLDSEGRPGFNLLHAQGFNPNSSQTSNIMQECYQAMPERVPVPVTAPGGPG
jgi:hypothetical protein